jgi:hypothetical protein
MYQASQADKADSHATPPSLRHCRPPPMKIRRQIGIDYFHRENIAALAPPPRRSHHEAASQPFRAADIF